MSTEDSAAADSMGTTKDINNSAPSESITIRRNPTAGGHQISFDSKRSAEILRPPYKRKEGFETEEEQAAKQRRIQYVLSTLMTKKNHSTTLQSVKEAKKKRSQDICSSLVEAGSNRKAALGTTTKLTQDEKTQVIQEKMLQSTQNIASISKTAIDNDSDDSHDSIRQKKNPNGFVKSFPQRLMEVISRKDMRDAIIWTPDGMSFLITSPKLFASKILPRFFKQTKYASFTRKLNRWGFKRNTKGINSGAYHHQFFRRDKPDLCLQICCQKTTTFTKKDECMRFERISLKEDERATSSGDGETASRRFNTTEASERTCPILDSPHVGHRRPIATEVPATNPMVAMDLSEPRFVRDERMVVPYRHSLAAGTIHPENVASPYPYRQSDYLRLISRISNPSTFPRSNVTHPPDWRDVSAPQHQQRLIATQTAGVPGNRMIPSPALFQPNRQSLLIGNEISSASQLHHPLASLFQTQIQRPVFPLREFPRTPTTPNDSMLRNIILSQKMLTNAYRNRFAVSSQLASARSASHEKEESEKSSQKDEASDSETESKEEKETESKEEKEKDSSKKISVARQA